MAIVQSKSRRKPSGARYKSKIIKKRQHLIGRLPAMTKIGAEKTINIRARSAAIKLRTLKTDIVNLYDPKSKTYSVEKINTVVESPADKNFIRRNIMTKGTIIKTTKGNAKITSRPGQTGRINAVLIE